MKPIYALLVGIDNYPAPTPKLGGSKADVAKIKSYLEKNFNDRPLHIMTLLDAEATYDNLIDGFRAHLGQATEGDVVWFHYSGHGSRQVSAPEFSNVNSGGKDETLVLYDSRPSGNDLADKELAVLLSELGAKNPHVLVTLDCCHSGSGTRSADAYIKRLDVDRGDKRTIDSYLKGYYKTRGVEIPESKYIFYAACNRFQSAKESFSGGGLFTENLIQTLNQSDKDISYADLLIKLRQGVVKMKWDQDPQLEVVGKTTSYTQFLDGTLVKDAPRYAVSHTDEGWLMEAGQILGITNDVLVAIIDDKSDQQIAKAKVNKASSVSAIITPEGSMKEDGKFWAVPLNIPVPFLVGLQADKELAAKLATQAANFLNVKFNTGDDTNDPFAVKQNNGYAELIRKEDGAVLLKAKTTHDQALIELIKGIDQIAMWTRFFNLQSNKTILSPESSKITMKIKDTSNEWQSFTPGEIKMKNDGSRMPYELWIQNQFTQPLNYAMIYLSDHYGAQSMKNEPLEKSDTPVLFKGSGPDDVVMLTEGMQSSTDIILVIISTERVDDFNFALDEMEFGEIASNQRVIPGMGKNTKVKGEWYTARFVIKLER